MGKTYDALMRADDERQKRSRGRPAAAAPPPDEPAATGWRRVVPERDGAERRPVDDLDLPLPTLPGRRPARGEIDWGAFVFDQVGSIDQKLEELHIALEQRFPESEARLQELIEARLSASEARLGGRLSGIADQLRSSLSRGRFQSILLLVNLALLLLLFVRLT